MNKGRNTILVVLIIIIAGAFLWYNRSAEWLAPLWGSNTATNTQSISGQANYSCDAGKTIAAVYYTGTAATSSAPGEPPVPNGSVELTLSGSSTMTLPQTLSGSGIRFANADESFVFWSKGNTAFITEGTGTNSVETYSNCVATSNIQGQESWNVYASADAGYSIKYPQGYTAVAPYTYEELGPGKGIKGVKFTIPSSMATGTNLSQDSYVSVEQLPDNASACDAGLFLGGIQAASSTIVEDSGVGYSMAKGADAGAGNRYDETVYAIPGSSQCTAVRYFIHYGAIGNYPAGAVKEFDEAALVSQFDAIRRSLVLSK